MNTTLLTGIAAEQLVVGYGRHRVLGPVSFGAPVGELTGLVGANGAGKTTLLKTLIGLLRPLSGHVRGLEARSVAYVPQHSALDEGFPVTVAEVVGMAVRQRSGRRGRVMEALVEVDLAERHRAPFFTLSGGQRQRVLFARALAADAKIIALDEPTAGVDTASSLQLWDLMRASARSGRIVLVVTHDLFTAPRFLDRTLSLTEEGLTETVVPGHG